ncbi:hypothetical protein HYH03_016643 [Edaphochlamys debaryana]|uniref:Uncharacterized protein n=1 Tax=Edaphochlamys debaryana TaxID=47281 RepID=A0A836BQ37_9CHLO|nr:hypothetical protein HYH03_016643 [Edaphochlamys debaryana]|eukprot:KAG2484602.1 hypothetical protein HYH03_016643 [Edaphochlamys debaryana]
MRAFPSTTELVMEVTFRRTAREKIQAALEEHFVALSDFGIHSLQLNLDLNSFNERKIKLPDVSLLASWGGLTRLTVQESGWRSQQLRVDAGTVFSSLTGLQELSVVCKYSGAVKAKWWRPPSTAERLAAKMPTWPPAAAAAAAAHAAAAAAAAAGGGGGGGPTHMSSLSAAPSPPGPGADGDAAMDEAVGTSGGAGAGAGSNGHGPRLGPGGPHSTSSSSAAAPPPPPPVVRPVVTQHLRCQMTQNQSMSAELGKALKRVTPALLPHISALTFEIVEETYAEPARQPSPLELSLLPGLKRLTVLSGAEEALANARLDIVGATGLESLVLFDVSCGCWCYTKAGHGIPPRLLSAPPACLRSLTVVGFVVNQCTNLHALSSLGCLEELRLERPEPDVVAGVSGELLLTWLPRSLKVLKLHSVILPPCGLPALPPTAALASTAPTAANELFNGGGGGTGGSATPAELLYGVAAVSPLPQLRELYLSKCKVPALGVLGVCPQLTRLGLINCLSCSGAAPAAAALPALRSLAVIHTLSPEQEMGPPGTGGPVGTGLPPPHGNFAAPPVGGGGAGGGPGPHPPFGMGGPGGPGGGGFPGGPGGFGRRGGAAAAAPAAASAAAPAVTPPLHVPGLPLPPVQWGSDDQVAAVAACRGLTSLELILPRGPAGTAAVASLASMTGLLHLDVCLPCGQSEAMLGLARLGPGPAGAGRLRHLTLWVDARTCVCRVRARQLQAIQRNLADRMPYTLVEWAAAEGRSSSWTGLEADVFSPH